MLGPRTCRDAARHRRSFTLLEMLIVITLLGILGAVIIPRFARSADKAKVELCASTVADIHVQVERWHFHTGQWPKEDLSDVGADKTYFPNGVPTCPVDGSAYVLDPTTHRVAGHNHSLVPVPKVP